MKNPVPTLFLSNNLFYPQTIIPLTVSDLASKQMVVSCYKNSTDIALYHPNPRSKGVGTMGRIILIENNADGSMNVVVQGLVRIKLLDMEKEDPYPLYNITDYLDVDEKMQTFSNSPVERLYHVFEGWLYRHVHSSKERERFMKEMSSPGKLINNLCMFVIKDLELKQIFLESTSLLDRVRMMNALLVGESPETEDLEMCEAIKNFERLEPDHFKNAS